MDNSVPRLLLTKNKQTNEQKGKGTSTLKVTGYGTVPPFLQTLMIFLNYGFFFVLVFCYWICKIVSYKTGTLSVSTNKNLVPSFTSDSQDVVFTFNGFRDTRSVMTFESRFFDLVSTVPYYLPRDPLSFCDLWTSSFLLFSIDRLPSEVYLRSWWGTSDSYVDVGRISYIISPCSYVFGSLRGFLQTWIGDRRTKRT